jgi:transposase
LNCAVEPQYRMSAGSREFLILHWREFITVAQEKAIEHKNFIVDCMDQDVLVLSLDEVSVRKGHRYETVLLDAKLGCVIGMDKDRSFQSTIDLLSRNVLFPESVQTIVMDMWDPFHKAVGSLFPHACIVIDKYHVVQKVTQALEQLRKQFPSLKKKRFILLKNFEKLDDEEKDQLDQLLEEHLELSYAYYLKELFRDFYYSEDYDMADELFEE